jgi:hypothetical protein
MLSLVTILLQVLERVDEVLVGAGDTPVTPVERAALLSCHGARASGGVAGSTADPSSAGSAGGDGASASEYPLSALV